MLEYGATRAKISALAKQLLVLKPRLKLYATCEQKCAVIYAESSVDSKAASPGPCYNPQVSLLNSKHSHGGGFSFGVGGRAPFYTVKF